ncbi:MAG: glycosyl transferase family 11 [Frankiales bacterium]|nr:glycosyl transferase family 11 [Frankiales bacterium]
MVIVRLYGGLGNQMFQYAAARALAHRLGSVLKLDLGWFDTQDQRHYGLNAFRVWENLADPAEIADITGRTFSRSERLALVIASTLRSRHAARLLSARGTLLREQRNFEFDARLATATGHLYMDGYWQSHKYFEHIRQIILREFDVQYEQPDRDRELSASIDTGNSIAVHVRRGDYATNSRAHEVHGLCTLDYYRNAIDFMIARVEEPSFFFFSDDPEWVKQNIAMPERTTVIDSDVTRLDCDDMRLMSKCAHHVIANSTFSWWGAWLAKRPGQLVVAPQQWFRTQVAPVDLFPSHWHVI